MVYYQMLLFLLAEATLITFDGHWSGHLFAMLMCCDILLNQWFSICSLRPLRCNIRDQEID